MRTSHRLTLVSLAVLFSIGAKAENGEGPEPLTLRPAVDSQILAQDLRDSRGRVVYVINKTLGMGFSDTIQQAGEKFFGPGKSFVISGASLAQAHSRISLFGPPTIGYAGYEDPTELEKFLDRNSSTGGLVFLSEIRDEFDLEDILNGLNLKIVRNNHARLGKIYDLSKFVFVLEGPRPFTISSAMKLQLTTNSITQSANIHRESRNGDLAYSVLNHEKAVATLGCYGYL